MVETLGSFGTTVTGSLVKSASDMTPMCDEPVCCVNVIVNGNVVSIGFYYVLTQKDPTQMFTAIAKYSPCSPHHAPSVCGSCPHFSLACALAMAPIAP